jgi:hypothetical protein
VRCIATFSATVVTLTPAARTRSAGVPVVGEMCVSCWRAAMSAQCERAALSSASLRESGASCCSARNALIRSSICCSLSCWAGCCAEATVLASSHPKIAAEIEVVRFITLPSRYYWLDGE